MNQDILNFTHNSPRITVYNSVNPCVDFDKTHRLEPIIGIVYCNSQQDPVDIKLTYCEKCKMIYLDKSLLDSYNSFYKGLILRYNEFRRPLFDGDIESPEYEKFIRNNRNKAFSELALHGYHVSGDDLSEFDRHRLLITLVLYQLMDEHQIAHQLKNHIQRRGKKNPEAKIIWQADMDFIKDYKNQIEKPEYYDILRTYNKRRYGSSPDYVAIYKQKQK